MYLQATNILCLAICLLHNRYHNLLHHKCPTKLPLLSVAPIGGSSCPTNNPYIIILLAWGTTTESGYRMLNNGIQLKLQVAS